MLSDFAIRLAGGLAFALLLTPWRLIPPAYFRTMSLVLLGIAVLAAVDTGWHSQGSLALFAAIAVAVLAYAAAVAWGLGFAHIGLGSFLAIALTEALTLISTHAPTRLGPSSTGFLTIASPLASGFLLGSALAAMLLGHHYLTAPAMSIDPLKRLIALTATALVLRALLAAAGLVLAFGPGSIATSHSTELPLLLAMRWVVGLAAPALAVFLAWRTALIRSTQSATGILYAGSTLILLGELAAQGLARSTGLPF